MEKKAAKRFYKDVTISQDSQGYQVMLDTRALKSPAKAALILPYQSLAEAIRAEFAAQEDEIRPESMPAFSLAATAIDRVMTQRDSLNEELVRFGHNDLICYRCSADEDPVLAERQQDAWGVTQSWMNERYGIQLQAFDGIMPQSQSAEITPLLEQAVSLPDDWRFVVLYRATTLTGSLSLGLAFLDGALDVGQLMALAFLDEYYQEEKWGADEWSVERRDNIETELKDAYSYLALLNEVSA